jgi:hypothetical protein
MRPLSASGLGALALVLLALAPEARAQAAQYDACGLDLQDASGASLRKRRICPAGEYWRASDDGQCNATDKYRHALAPRTNAIQLDPPTAGGRGWIFQVSGQGLKFAVSGLCAKLLDRREMGTPLPALGDILKTEMADMVANRKVAARRVRNPVQDAVSLLARAHAPAELAPASPNAENRRLDQQDSKDSLPTGGTSARDADPTGVDAAR